METIRVGKWDVPKNLYEQYIRFRIIADSYAENKADYPAKGSPMGEQERAMRWSLCVQQIMKVHREICEAIGVPYSEEDDDEFYKAFIWQTNKDSRGE